MPSNNYNNSFTINKSAKEVFESLTQKISKWWSTDFEGNAQNIGDQFTVRFGNSFKTFTIEDLVPDSKVVWRCIAQHIDHPEIKNQTEWINTLIIWTILPDDFSVKVNLLHEGLTTDTECYAICEKGWNSFTASLFALLESGNGLPYSNQ